ncbi:MAG: sensor histidine kinase [Prolixibacteraceae bacterium]|nr:sensor histidine kinase [Prolixibacteraceae bacterium]
MLINLANNSIDALNNQERGKIKLSGEINEYGRVQISVSDNGPGIGLSLSRQIMFLHGGNLKVVSAPNVKTTFILEF